MKTSARKSRIISTIALAGAVLAPAFSIQAAETLPVGSELVNAGFITDYQAKFDLVTVNAEGETEADGHWTDIVSHVERGDKKLLRREVARYNEDGQRDLWRVHLADAQTLAPTLTHDRTGAAMENIVHIDYAGATVTATAIQAPETPALHLSRDLEAAPFDLSLWAPLLMSVHREAGFVAEVPVLGPGLALASETITVHGAEIVEHPAGKSIDTWKISTTSRPWTLWVMEKAPYIVRIDKDLGDGKRSVSWLQLD